MRRFVAAALILGLPGLLSPALAGSCGGQDLRERFLAQEPAQARALQEKADATAFGRGRLFRVSAPGVAPSYLFGTMHVAEARAVRMPTGFEALVTSASAVALEVAEAEGLADPAVIAARGPSLLPLVVARPEEQADRLLPSATFSRLEAVVETRGQPRAVARVLKPAILATMMALPLCASGAQADYVDALVARMARKAGVPIVGLETLEEQLGLLAGFPPLDQRALLDAALSVADIQEDVFETTIRRYSAGEIGWLMAWTASGRPAPGITAAPPKAFMRDLIDRRNLRMRDRSLALLRKGGAVIAVGAAHIPGEAGLARLYEAEGFTIEMVE